MGEITGDTIRIVAIGGSTRPDSSSERALLAAVRGARAKGAHVDVITSRDLLFPIYDTETTDRDPLAVAYLAKVAQADGLIIASPGYHGAISGMMKNALDYIEDLRDREGGYLHGMSVGCISVAYGWQATVSTLQQLRQIAHALRGWPGWRDGPEMATDATCISHRKYARVIFNSILRAACANISMRLRSQRGSLLMSSSCSVLIN